VALGQSSGHDVLDRDAVEAVQRLSPLRLNHPLGRTQQSLNLPIAYTLDR
jgi:outer membrane biosynthesis protein TonB